MRLNRLLIGVAVLAFLVQMNVLPPENPPPLFAWMLSISHHLQIILLLVGSGLVTSGFSQSALRGQQSAGSKSANQQVSRQQKTSEPPVRLYAALRHFVLSSFHFVLHALKAKSQELTANSSKITLAALIKSPLFWILLLALGVRLWDLELAITRFLDEIHYMDAVVRLWHSPQPIYIPFSDVTAFTWVYPYIQSWTAWLMGPSLTSIRIISVLFGVAQVAAVHFLGKQLFDRKTALAAALVMATFPVHVHFSRIGINNIADPVLGTLALGFLVKGLRTQQRRDFLLAGYCLGWTQYFYEGGRLFFAPFLLLWLGWFWLFLRRKTELVFPSRGNLLALTGVALALIVPVVYVYGVQLDTLTPRLAQMFDNTQEYQLRNEAVPLPERLQTTLFKLPVPLTALISAPDTSWFYGGDFAIILPYVLPFFGIGVLYCVWQWRSAGSALLLWWILGAAFGISFMSTPLEFPRYLVMLPAVTLIMGIGIAQSLHLITGLLSKIFKHNRLAQRFSQLLIIGIVVYITCIQAGYYALVHIPNFYHDLFVRDGNGNKLPDTDDALLRAAFLPADTTAVIVSQRPIYPINMETIPAFWGRDDLVIRYVKPERLEFFLSQLPLHQNYAFFLERYDWLSLELLRTYFHLSDKPEFHGGLSPYRLPEELQMILFYAPGGVTPQVVLPPPLLTPGTIGETLGE